MATTHLDEVTGDLPPLITASRIYKTLITVWSGYVPVRLRRGRTVAVYQLNYACGIHSSEILWHRRAPSATALQSVVPLGERRGFIQRYHNSIFAGHLGVSRTVCRLLDRVYWPGLLEDVWSYHKKIIIIINHYLAGCSVCLARKFPCPRRAPMGHVLVGHRWDRMAMDILDMSVTTTKGNRYVLVIVDCFSRWTEACPLTDKTALAVADAFFQLIICRFGMPAVIHSDQGREFENHLMQELRLLLGVIRLA